MGRKFLFLVALLIFSSNWIMGQSFFNTYENGSFQVTKIHETNSGFELETGNGIDFLNVDGSGNLISTETFPGFPPTFNNPPYLRLSNGNYLNSPNAFFNGTSLEYEILTENGVLLNSFTLDFPNNSNFGGSGVAEEYSNGDLLISFHYEEPDGSNFSVA